LSINFYKTAMLRFSFSFPFHQIHDGIIGQYPLQGSSTMNTAHAATVPTARKSTPITVVADDREPCDGVVSSLRSFPDTSVLIKRLPCGDYLVDGRILFERKTLADFDRSIVDGRLFPQMLRMAKSKHRPVLILEGGGKDAEGLGVRREALQGALITISLILGIPVLRALNPEETARLMVYAARQVLWAGKEGGFRPGYRPKGKKSRQLYILQGLPGVGETRAMKLLEKFGSVSGVMGANREELVGVEGLGPKLADAILGAVREKGASYGDSGFSKI
jgi:ERCC4-type nuclease